MNKYIAAIINELLDEELAQSLDNMNTALIDKYLNILDKLDKINT